VAPALRSSPAAEDGTVDVSGVPAREILIIALVHAYLSCKYPAFALIGISIKTLSRYGYSLSV
jgi:hypothetical protein